MVRYLIKYVRLVLVLASFAMEVKLLLVILAINHFYITLLPQPVQLSVLWDGFNRHLIFIYVYHAILSVKVAKIILQLIVLLAIQIISYLVIRVAIFVLRAITRIHYFKFVPYAKLCVYSALDKETSNVLFANLIYKFILILI